MGLGFKAGFVRVSRSSEHVQGAASASEEGKKFLPLSKKMCCERISVRNAQFLGISFGFALEGEDGTQGTLISLKKNVFLE